MNAKKHCKKVPRVLHVVPGFRSGGIESLLMSLYSCLDKKKLQFDFMVDTYEELPEFDEIRASGGRVFQMGRYLDSLVGYHCNLNKVFKKYGNEYVALHIHAIDRAFPVIWAARKYNISQKILHAHTDSLQGDRFVLIKAFIARVTVLLATDYWACSEAAGRFFFGRRACKVSKNTIQTERFAFNPNDGASVRELLGIKQNALVIGHTGRFTYQKNHAWIIKVFSELHRFRSDARLLLVGDGPLQPEIQDLVVELGLKKVVFFVGLKKDVAPYLSAMDVFLLPSHNEGFCISLLEAQANGLRSLAYDVIPDEVQVTSSIITCAADASVSEFVKSLLHLHQLGRADSASNIALIREAGCDSKLQADSLPALYNIKQL
ncbi:glycosyltransferase [Marinobacter sp. AL4B]|uniref:glycosyltransferase n=1 Tax=Marinobacter sp. AL4B TaxID=2871173 RepID=UPI001CAA5790|nr:glycosyltransferase [Marinobacter sp. AL4B]MBZ0333208.1 glycosyltransferase [Marinobacter sp. AL4B]